MLRAFHSATTTTTTKSATEAACSTMLIPNSQSNYLMSTPLLTATMAGNSSMCGRAATRSINGTGAMLPSVLHGLSVLAREQGGNETICLNHSGIVHP